MRNKLQGGRQPLYGVKERTASVTLCSRLGEKECVRENNKKGKNKGPHRLDSKGKKYESAGLKKHQRVVAVGGPARYHVVRKRGGMANLCRLSFWGSLAVPGEAWGTRQ